MGRGKQFAECLFCGSNPCICNAPKLKAAPRKKEPQQPVAEPQVEADIFIPVESKPRSRFTKAPLRANKTADLDAAILNLITANVLHSEDVQKYTNPKLKDWRLNREA